MDSRRILFIGGDAGGNVPPALAVARELARRGHRVELAGIQARDPREQPVGTVSLPLPAVADLDLTRASGGVAALSTLGRLCVGRAVASDVRTVVSERRPDVIVVDCAMFSAQQAALRSGVPTVALFHSFGAFWIEWVLRGPGDLVLRMLGLRASRLWRSAALRILPTDRQLDPVRRMPADMTFDWVGTTEVGVAPAPRIPGERPLVLVSLSSAWARGQADAYRRIIVALGELPVRAIVTTGGTEVEGGLQSRPNVDVQARIPHSELLPLVDLVIGHGGHSTTLKTLAHGVPLLVIPMNPMSDQAMIGRAVTSAGLGRTLPRTAPSTAIRDAVRGILADPAYRAAAARAGERLRAQQGASVAADRIEALLLDRVAAERVRPES